MAEKFRFDPVRNKKMEKAVVIVIDRRDTGWSVADHAELERLTQKCRIELILKIDSCRLAHIHELRLITDHPVPVDQRRFADSYVSGYTLKFHQAGGKIKARVISNLLGTDQFTTH